MPLWEKMKGKNLPKIWISWEEKSFLDETKTIFYSFWGISFGGKRKNSRHKI